MSFRHVRYLSRRLAGVALTLLRMSGKRILFIDDELLICEMMCGMLADLDYEVVAEESGQDGIRTFLRDPDAFDLVLTDLMMLGMTGDSVSERIRSDRADIPIVLMTGTPGTLAQKTAATKGICKVLCKPLTKAEFRKALQGIL